MMYTHLASWKRASRPKRAEFAMTPLETVRRVTVSITLMRLLSTLFLPVLAGAAVWPETFGEYQRVSRTPAPVIDRALWDELGFQEAEQAVYTSGQQKFEAKAQRFLDTTGAMAAFQAQRPADAKPYSVETLAVETRDGALIAFGNYLFAFDGHKPSQEQLKALYGVLPKLEQASLPGLIEQLPEQGLVPNSGRYIVGPEGLANFEPSIPPATAGFHMGTEAQAGVYNTPAGEMKLTVFSFPTPQIAQQRVPEFEKIAGAMVKRSGPLVAITVAPPDPNAAERLLAQMRYEATITWSEHVPTQRDNVGDLVINAFILVGLLLVFAFVSSVAFGGLRVLWRRRRGGEEAESMILLHLGDRR